MRKKNFRKEQRIAEVLKERGRHPGLVWIFSALEPCTTYAPKYSPKRKTYLVAKDNKCLHYYIYFIDEEFGLCYLRVPTWAPLRLQFYCNLHNWLAIQLKQAGIENHLVDNAFVQMGDWEQAQKIADGFEVAKMHAKLEPEASTFPTNRTGRCWKPSDRESSASPACRTRRCGSCCRDAARNRFREPSSDCERMGW